MIKYSFNLNFHQSRIFLMQNVNNIQMANAKEAAIAITFIPNLLVVNSVVLFTDKCMRNTLNIKIDHVLAHTLKMMIARRGKKIKIDLIGKKKDQRENTHVHVVHIKSIKKIKTKRRESQDRIPNVQKVIPEDIRIQKKEEQKLQNGIKIIQKMKKKSMVQFLDKMINLFKGLQNY